MLRFMKNKILIPLLILGALATFFSFKYSGGEQNDDQRKTLVLQTVVKAINQGHFSPQKINDSFSTRVYNKLLNTLDYEKKFFTQADINQLKQYQFQIDDQINNGSVEFFTKLDAIFQKRISDGEAYYKDMLSRPFSFTGNEQVELNGEKIDWAAGDEALKDRWNKVLKYRVLARYVDAKKAQEKSKDSLTAAGKFKTDAELEQEARDAVRKNQDLYFKRLRKIDDKERFTLYVNSITNSQDPHTDYLPPIDKQRFDESMSGTFFGIGAQLKDEDGKIKIASVIAGSPSWKQGRLKAGDEIQKVAQGADEPVDIQGYDIEDAVKLIRGKKGTEVRLTVKKVNGATEVIPIIRGEVLLDDVFAKSALIQGPTGPIGYIYLPEFYSDFQNINGRRSAEDVGKEVAKLKNAGVTGIILDLRNNGGGSLSDVVDMSGLFIDQGPIVQVKSSNASPMTLRDQNKGIQYDGPLVVMVNQNSASASEILAAAMQDYKRAVIVGSTTYGKGTVQKLISLDDFMSMSDRLGGLVQNRESGKAGESEDAIGSLKLTVQKFYRVNGGSTQLKGVVPDIDLPDPYQHIDMGERRDKAALKWDEIPAANYNIVSNPVNVAQIAAASKKRVSNNATFDLIKESAKRMKQQQDDNQYALNENGYRKQLEEANATSKKMEELEKKVTPLNITNLQEDMARINMDSSTIQKNSEWLKNMKKDIYLAETINIIADIAKQNVKVSMGENKR
ncbi:MAG: tail-specific protease [Sphingobacteriales bacterium]|nr:MAG: tail-specific protease [Sphingobacteriales bacterium]